MQIRYKHFPEDRYSIGYTVQQYQEDPSVLLVRVAEAVCGPHDNFNHRIARDIISGRLNCRRDNVPHVVEFEYLEDEPTTSEEWEALEKEADAQALAARRQSTIPFAVEPPRMSLH